MQKLFENAKFFLFNLWVEVLCNFLKVLNLNEIGSAGKISTPHFQKGRTRLKKLLTSERVTSDTWEFFFEEISFWMKIIWLFSQILTIDKISAEYKLQTKKHSTSFSYIWCQSGVRSYLPMSSNVGHPIKCW